VNFLQPLFLLGLLAVAVPIVIHLINRQKAVRRPFPALKLLESSRQREAKSLKVRQWLLLALRIAAVALLALALAKPYVLSSRGLTTEERLPSAVVFVLDDGFAMNYGDWWPQARRQLEREISELRPWDEATVLTTTEPSPAVRMTSDHSQLRRAIGQREVTPRAGDLLQALQSASELLSASQLPNRRIVVVSPFTEGVLPGRRERELQIPHPVELLPIGQRDERHNLAITRVEYVQEGSPQERTWRFDVTVHNLGGKAADAVPVELVIGEQVVATALVGVDARSSVIHSFRHRIETAGLQPAMARLVDADPLATDDAYHFTIHPREHVRALLVNGKPSSIPYDDELFFLLRALRPGAQSESPIIPTVTTIDGLETRDLNGFDVVHLANVGRISPQAGAKLREYVESGGGLFITLGDQVDVENYNTQLGELLPRRLRSLKQLAMRDDPDAPVKVTRLGHANRQHPVFRVFGLPGGTSLQSVQVFSYMLLEPAPASDETRQLLAFQDSGPALLERTVGQGRVLLWTTTIDREWTDFPVRTAYLPLTRRKFMYLARRSASQSTAQHIVGQPVRLDVAGLVRERAIIRAPSGARLVLDPIDGEVLFTALEAGVHEVYADSDEGSESARATHRLDGLAFSANVDSRASRLDMLDLTAFEASLTPDSDAQARAALYGDGDQRRVNLWSKILFIITLILLAETMIGTRRSVLQRLGRRLLFRKDPPVEA
jgi:hypothetical protein